ncbi:HDOD domain-containing protein [Sulfurimonas sp. SAG-AH-194-C20]|nr:HDOD domain-containing protein [Sulfurimonas sp. SAG-AH-194-C20]MDF1878757.1 HDOD domain-containing protein [Sulfurimonas sp. SAG-AH-194-C20]
MSYIPLIAKVDSLPPLPESVLKIESLFMSDEPEIDDIVKVIEGDPSLTADILAKVNAPYYGFSKNIISILQAVTLFGSSQIRSIVLSSSINRCFDIDLSPYDLSTIEFSKISSIQSELIFQWYMGIDIDIARSLTPIAFLMETGKILIAKDILQNKKTEAFLSDLIRYQDIAYVENIHTMMTTAQINALIFKHLHLNDTFWESMKYLDDEREVPKHMKEMVFALQVVRSAVNIQEQFSENSMKKALGLLTDNNFSTDSFVRISKRLQRKYLD